MEKVYYINIGDIVFSNIKYITSWESDYCEGDSLFDEDGYGSACTFGCGYEDTYKKVYESNDMLIALKYLGEGLYEEMTTGEVLLATNMGGIRYSDKPKYCGVGGGYMYDILQFGMPHTTLFLEDQKKLAKFPMIFLDSYEELYELNDDSMMKYLEYSDEERKKIMLRIKELSEKQTKKFVRQVDSAINSLKGVKSEYFYEELTDDILELAYLENKLFDFKHKVKTR